MTPSIAQLAARHKGILVGVGMAVTMGWAAVSGARGLRELREKQEQIRQLQEENAQLQSENADRRRRVQRLESSPSEQDIEIRKLNLTKPGETIFMLPEAEKVKGKSRKSKR